MKLSGSARSVCTPSDMSRPAHRFLVSCAAIGRAGRATRGRGRDAEVGALVSDSFGSMRESDIVSRATRGLPTLGDRIAPS